VALSVVQFVAELVLETFSHPCPIWLFHFDCREEIFELNLGFVLVRGYFAMLEG